VAAADPKLVAVRVLPMQSLVDDSVARPRFNALLLSAFAVLAGTLAVIGVYGVISYVVSQRTQEIGIRLALGAGRSDVLRLVAAEGMGLVLAGVALGLAGALAGTRILSSLLFGISPTDAGIFAGVGLLLASIGLAAAVIPAMRAARMDPLVALRYE
jgi:putative ABC transport system permease protein